MCVAPLNVLRQQTAIPSLREVFLQAQTEHCALLSQQGIGKRPRPARSSFLCIHALQHVHWAGLSQAVLLIWLLA